MYQVLQPVKYRRSTVKGHPLELAFRVSKKPLKRKNKTLSARGRRRDEKVLRILRILRWGERNIRRKEGKRIG
jgi:hypothetical protein